LGLFSGTAYWYSADHLNLETETATQTAGVAVDFNCVALNDLCLLKQNLSLFHGVENILDVVQELIAHTGTTSSRMRLPMRFPRFVLMATSTFVPSRSLSLSQASR
jgi:hypothetical protein